MRPAVLLVLGLLAAGCAKQEQPAGPSPAPATASASAAATLAVSASPSATSTPYAGADELGRVPVLMYHQLLAKPGRDDVTPDQFRTELERLYDEGYRPVTAADLVEGHVDIPAGRHPVVLTLDDATISQALIGPDGQPRPDTALGILEEFGRAHPDFHPTATFFVNTSPPPFTDDKVLPWLAAHGYEIGAHTRSHAFLRDLDDAGVQKQIGLNVQEIETLVPGYTVRTFATTGGLWPRNAALARQGSYDGKPYAFEGVFGVDEISAPSPYAERFDAFQVPRAGTGDVKTVLDALRKSRTAYVSDGDPGAISFPAARSGELAAKWRDRARPY